jgi:hypothetical protein
MKAENMPMAAPDHNGVPENIDLRWIATRLLRGEPLELVARETNVSIARLSEWRERALAGAATALKECDDRD